MAPTDRKYSSYSASSSSSTPRKTRTVYRTVTESRYEGGKTHGSARATHSTTLLDSDGIRSTRTVEMEKDSEDPEVRVKIHYDKRRLPGGKHFVRVQVPNDSDSDDEFMTSTRSRSSTARKTLTGSESTSKLTELELLELQAQQLNEKVNLLKNQRKELEEKELMEKERKKQEAGWKDEKFKDFMKTFQPQSFEEGRKAWEAFVAGLEAEVCFDCDLENVCNTLATACAGTEACKFPVS
ncbi:hypothetical protein BJ508DRAFT_378362 [Ascobolus immersus RN42]|uniref:Uncharacterized protein n=1 Tax=Ascobolus immersus RN42 TaxID=1160509 RepID=A0A3N4HYZ3_ASCIM|nr:hypothetical protein BJ508DRAFT_378362 [Ascobolus immersus RN42]